MTELNVEQARYNMIEQQVRPWEVLDDRILEVIQYTPREDFVPKAYRNLAFADLQIPLGHEEVMMEPRLEGRLLQTLNPQPNEEALEIGTGSGYLTACLARLAAHVTSVDIHEDFRDGAQASLTQCGITNADLTVGDASKGWNDGRRYDVIAVTGSLPELHEGFQQSLTLGGRLFLIVGEGSVMEALLITRVDENQWATDSLFDTSIRPLANAPRRPRFTL